MSASEPGVVTGVVEDADGNPVEGVTCILKRQSDNEVFETTTDVSGVYRFEGLQEGVYHGIVRWEDGQGNLYNSRNQPYIQVVGPAIPDAQLTWAISEGSGSEVEDSAGSNNGTISGASWVTGSSYFDGAGLDFATNDYVEASSVVDYLDHDGSWTVAFSLTLETTSTGREIFTATTSDSGDSTVIATNDDGIGAFVYDGSSITDGAGNAPLSTGSAVGVIVTNNAGSLSVYWPSGSSSTEPPDLGGQIWTTAHTRLGTGSDDGIEDGVVDILQLDNSVWGSDKRQQFFDALP